MHRPQWQSSLRRVVDVVPGNAGPRGMGTTWTDVTVVPGVRPRLWTSESLAGRRWVEIGRWGAFSARLELCFEETDEGCLVTADFRVGGLGLGRLITRLGRPAVAADLAAAARLLGATPERGR